MRLPTRPADRLNLYRELLHRCAVSRGDRRERYRRYKTWYYTGSDSGGPVRYNKLAEHVQFSASYLLAPDNVRWGVALPPQYGEEWIIEESVARDELTRTWHDSEAGMTAAMCVTWAHIYDSVVAKVLVSDNEPTLLMIPDTADIGVRDEQVHEWDRQEAICHWYTVDLDTFRRMVSALPSAEKRIELLREASVHAMRAGEAEGETLPPTVQRVLIAASSPNMIGQAQAAPDTSLARARSDEPVVQLAELWIRDDEARDFRVVTMFVATEDVLWQPVNPLVSNEHAFHPLSLETTPGYIWGLCPMERLVQLQRWREEKIGDLDERQGRQIDPPMFFKGFANVDGEKAVRFRRRGGNIVSNVPNAEVQPFPPSPLPDEFGMLHEIDQEFSRAGGLPRSLQGQAEPGARGGEQQMAMAMLGAGPTLRNAQQVEDWLEGVGTAMLRLQRRTSGKYLIKPDGSKFLLAQMPGEFVARVWAHSSSPLYAQQLLQRAVIAKDKGAIDSEDLLEFLDLPLTDVRLKAKARKLAEAQAAQRERMLKVKELEAQAKEEKARK